MGISELQLRAAWSGPVYPGQCLLPVVSSGTASAAGGFLTCWVLKRRLWSGKPHP